MSLSLNPLANPRGTKLQCEICQKSAFSQCTHCRVTYYCGRDHQAEDWDGIHSKVCTLLAAIRAPKPFLNSEEQRYQYESKKAKKQKQLVSLTSTEAQRLLYDGQYKRALPAAQLSLRSSTEMYGSGRMELIPALVVLAEACIGAFQLDKAEQYLSQAKWSALQAGESCPSGLLSQINRVLGRLHIARGSHGQAMAHLAEDVYHSSLAHGPEHVKTSGGYFNMARSFYAINNMPAARPLYTEVLSIWYKFLTVVAATEDSEDEEAPVLEAGSSILLEDIDKDVKQVSPFAKFEKEIDEASRAEAVFMFTDIIQTLSAGRIAFSKEQECQCHWILSILCSIVGKTDRVNEHYDVASSLCVAEGGNAELHENVAKLGTWIKSASAQDSRSRKRSLA
eukprot:scpid62658/ scgid32859/ Zinc finger MYND domain-containing protein 12